MKSMNVGIVGSGDVAQALAAGFLANGHPVTLGTRDPKKLDAWKARVGVGAHVGSFEEAAKFGDMVVIAVKGSAAEGAVRACVRENLEGKTVIDATNPIADGPAEGGVMRSFLGPNESLMERLQAIVPKASFVKAFSCVGSAYMVNPHFAGGKPTMFICGEDDAAKRLVTDVLSTFGWEAEDMGGAVAARAIEPLATLWCIPGFLRGDWGPRAFKLLK